MSQNVIVSSKSKEELPAFNMKSNSTQLSIQKPVKNPILLVSSSDINSNLSKPKLTIKKNKRFEIYHYPEHIYIPPEPFFPYLIEFLSHPKIVSPPYHYQQQNAFVQPQYVYYPGYGVYY